MVKITAESTGVALEQEVGEDIRQFEYWFKQQGNDPLVRSEIAILKTYLFYKTRVAATEG